MSSITIATASYDRHIRLWEARTGRPVRQIAFQESQVNCMALSPDRTKLAAGGNPTIRIFDIGPSTASVNPQISVSEEGKHTNNVTSLGYLRTARPQPTPLHTAAANPAASAPILYSTSEDAHLKFWEIRAPSLRLRRDVTTAGPINCSAVMPDQSYMMTGNQFGTVQVWPLAVAMEASGTVLLGGTSGGSQNGSQAGDVSGGAAMSQFYSVQDIPFGEDSPIRSISISPEGNLMVVGTNAGVVHCLRIKVDVTVAPPMQRTNTSVAGSASPTGEDGSPMSSFDLSPANQSSPPNGIPGIFVDTFHSFQAHQKYVLRCQISPNAKLLVTTSADFTMSLWAIPDEKVRYGGLPLQADATAKPASPIKADASPLIVVPPLVGAVESPSSGRLATGGASAFTSPATWPLQKTFNGHTRWVWDCAFSSCSGYLVSASSDHTARLWEVESGKSIVSYNHQKPVTCVIVEDRKD